jgi:LAO/AO transport system kinase
MTESGDLATRRSGQARGRMWAEIGDTLLDRVRADRGVAALLPGLEQDVAAGRLAPGTAARRVLDRLFGGPPDGPA